MSNNTALQTISSTDLETASGGGVPVWVKPAAKIVGKKVLGPVSAAWTAYDGVRRRQRLPQGARPGQERPRVGRRGPQARVPGLGPRHYDAAAPVVKKVAPFINPIRAARNIWNRATDDK